MMDDFYGSIAGGMDEMVDDPMGEDYTDEHQSSLEDKLLSRG